MPSGLFETSNCLLTTEFLFPFMTIAQDEPIGRLQLYKQNLTSCRFLAVRVLVVSVLCMYSGGPGTQGVGTMSLW